MQKVLTVCDICEKAYDPAKEADEPMHRVGLMDPPVLGPEEEARLDAELKVIQAEIRNTATTVQAKAYYEQRIEAMTTEATKRRQIAADERVDVDLICHTCFVALRDHVKQMKGARR